MSKSNEINEEISNFLCFVNVAASSAVGYSNSSAYEQLEHFSRRLSSSNKKTMCLLDKAIWCQNDRVLIVNVNLSSATLLPCTGELFIFIPDSYDLYPFAYASATASPDLIQVVEDLNRRFSNRQESLTALSMFHEIESSVQSAHVKLEEEELRSSTEKRLHEKISRTFKGSDLLISLFVCAAGSKRRNTLLLPFPPAFAQNHSQKDFNLLDQVIRSLPSLAHLQTNLYKNISTQELYLFDWLLNRLPVGLSTDDIPPNITSLSQDPSLTCIAQVIESEDPYFLEQAEKYGTQICFHGSSFENIYSILQNGLKNMSGTRRMSSGAVFGDGIYLAEKLDVAKQFMSFTPSLWQQSLFKSTDVDTCLGCVLLCQSIKLDQHIVQQPIIGGSIDGKKANYFVVQDERLVKVKAVLVYSNVVRRKRASTSMSYYLVIILSVMCLIYHYMCSTRV